LTEASLGAFSWNLDRSWSNFSFGSFCFLLLMS